MGSRAHLADDLKPGELLGAFEVLALIAHGGMGTVYRARNTLTRELRAIKVIREDFASDPRMAARFMREIRIATRLRHPGLVEVFEPAVDGTGRILLPMELLEGETLYTYLEERRRMAPSVAASVLVGIAEAVGFLHKNQVVHRDLKPNNIFLVANGRGGWSPKILDLGVARAVEPEPGEHATGVGEVVGSPHYMAPEQARGHGGLDASVDQYALAIIAYHVLTGARPYEGDSAPVATAKLLQSAPYPKASERARGLPAALDEAIARATSLNPNDRFPSIEEFASTLARALDGIDAVDATHAPSASRLSVSRTPASRGSGHGPVSSKVREKGGARRELFLPPQFPVGAAPPVTPVRSTLLSASVQGLRALGWEERYFKALPREHHEAIRLLAPGAWLPIELGMVHYQACNDMGLTVDEMKHMGDSVSVRTQKTFVGTVGSVAAGAGATPWHIYKQGHRIWGRIFQGGDHAAYKLGPKDMDIIVMGCPILRIRYFRVAIGAYYAALARLLSTAAHWRELPEHQRDDGIGLRVSWV